MPKHPKELSKDTRDRFRQLVPAAVEVEEAVFRLQVQGTPGNVRVKRAAKMANQVHVCRGEPLVVHVPTGNSHAWYVVPVTWQLAYARAHAHDAAQHASHAFDCMFFKPDALDPNHRVPEADLQRACEAAVLEARDPIVRVMIKAITRARDAVTNALIDTLQEELPDGRG